MYDILIQNATVMDGSGKEPYTADVAIAGGKIQKIGSISEVACRVIDAKGLVLSPGFIDSHSHGDRLVDEEADHREALEQGITFGAAGHCGDSIAPSQKYSTVAQLMERVEKAPISTNYGLLVGHGALRLMVAGRENRLLTEAELSQMVAMLEESLDGGAIGMSLGLTYTPGSYADRHELETLARVLGKRGGILTAHIRNESDQLIESVEEFISLCEIGGCRGVISHLKAADKANHGKVRQVLSMVEQAAERGVDIYADAYPYCASSTSLQSRFVPRQFHPMGIKDVNSLLYDPAVCQRIKAWAMEKWGEDLSWVLVTVCPAAPEYVGKTMNEIAQSMGMEDRYEAVFELLRLTKGRCNACFTMMCEEDVAYVLSHPRVMVGCDSFMGSKNVRYHPRRRGTFPRVLGRYVREQEITSLPEMIRKITALPAQVYGLSHKGRIREGYDADLCLFDPKTIRDTADYVNCSSPNVGIHYVILSGQIVVEQGEYNGTRAGKLYRKAELHDA